MARGRWIAALGMLVAGVLAAIVAAPGGAAAPRPDLCIIDCATTTATAPASPVIASPTPGAVTVSHQTGTTAVFSGLLDTGGQTDGYGFELTTPDGMNASPGSGSVPAEPNPATVSVTARGLIPNSTYRTEMYANGNDPSEGQPAVFGPPVTFKTPMLSALGLSIKAVRSEIVFGQSVSVTGVAARAGAVDSGDTVDIQVHLPDGQWADQATATLGPGHRLAAHVYPNRNSRIRAMVTGENAGDGTTRIRPRSYSAPVTVIVEPRASLSVERPNDGPNLEIFYVADVHGLPRGYRGEPVYFYTAAPNSRQVHLLGSKRLTYQAQKGELIASWTFRDVDGAEGVGCVKHQLLPDMGLPFTYSACGDATLPVN